MHNLYVCTALVIFGLIIHFVMKLQELETQGVILTPWVYWTQHPYTSLSVILMAFAFMALQQSSGELTYASAILTGIAANSLGDKLRARAGALK